MFRNFFRRQARPAQPRSFFRPCVEGLEARDVPSTTALTVSSSPATAGQPLTLTATVTESGSDSVQPGLTFFYIHESPLVQFFDGSTFLGGAYVIPKQGDNPPDVNQGSAQLTLLGGLAAGTHSLTAQYPGEAVQYNTTLFRDAGSTSPAVTEVVKAPPASPTSSQAAPVSLTAAGAGWVVLMPVLQASHHHGSPAVQQFTLVNTAHSAVEGPLFIVLRGLNRNVHVKGHSGATLSGSPFILLSAGGLAAGQSMPLTLSFSNPGNAHIHFTAEVVDASGLL